MNRFGNLTMRTMLRPVGFWGWLGGMTSMGVAVALAAGRGCTGAGELEARAGIEPTYEDLQTCTSAFSKPLTLTETFLELQKSECSCTTPLDIRGL